MVAGVGITWTLAALVVILVQAAYVPRLASATKMFYIHWNTSNPIFRIDNTDHIIDVNKGNLPFEYDQVNIICPVYEQQDRSYEEAEKYIIYIVSKEEYETCRITNPSPRIIAVCDKPHQLMYFTITFRSFTPQPGGLEFKPGEDYYFISTSSKDDLHRRIGGRCTSHNMKVVFKVCCHPDQQLSRDQANGYLPVKGASTPARDSAELVTTESTKFPRYRPPSTPKSTSTTSLSTSTVRRTLPPRRTTIIKTQYSFNNNSTKNVKNGPKTAGTKKISLSPNTGGKKTSKNSAVQKELSSSSSTLKPDLRWHHLTALLILLTLNLL